MADAAALPARRSRTSRGIPLATLGGGVALLWLSLIVLLPLVVLATEAFDGGAGEFWEAATSAQARKSLVLTFFLSLLAAGINAVAGTMIAWVLVRDRFRGKRIVEGLIDLPFALPTIVAGLTLLALYGNSSPLSGLGINLAGTTVGLFLALLFVTVPFVVRSVQPVLMALEPETEEAAASLGARPGTVVRRVVLPSLRPAILSGSALAFARALGEFGAVVLIAGSAPGDAQYASIFIFGQIESGAPQAAAAVSVVLLIFSLMVLLLIEWAERRTSRHAY